MISNEELIKRFADYVYYFHAYCTSDVEDHEMLKAVLALLKEQQEEIENLKQTAQSMMEGIVVSVPMEIPCSSCQEFNCDFCRYKAYRRAVK